MWGSPRWWSIAALAIAACSPTRSHTRSPRTNEPVYEKHSYAVSFIPFGAGQFQNGEPAKGVGFAIAEGVTAVTSLGVWFYLVDKYGVSGPRVSQEDASQVRLLQRIEIGSGVAFLGLATWGVIDALVHFEPRVEVRDTAVSITPIPIANGAGVALSWSN